MYSPRSSGCYGTHPAADDRSISGWRGLSAIVIPRQDGLLSNERRRNPAAMRNTLLKIAATVLLVTALTMATAGAQVSRAPDLILAHGTILTVDPHDSVG